MRHLVQAGLECRHSSCYSCLHPQAHCHWDQQEKPCACRCLEELGRWDELLGVVEDELDARAQAPDAPAGPSGGRFGKDSLLFDSGASWHGPKYLR